MCVVVEYVPVCTVIRVSTEQELVSIVFDRKNIENVGERVGERSCEASGFDCAAEWPNELVRF